MGEALEAHSVSRICLALVENFERFGRVARRIAALRFGDVAPVGLLIRDSRLGNRCAYGRSFNSTASPPMSGGASEFADGSFEQELS